MLHVVVTIPVKEYFGWLQALFYQYNNSGSSSIETLTAKTNIINLCELSKSRMNLEH